MGGIVYWFAGTLRPAQEVAALVAKLNKRRRGRLAVFCPAFLGLTRPRRSKTTWPSIIVSSTGGCADRAAPVRR